MGPKGPSYWGTLQPMVWSAPVSHCTKLSWDSWECQTVLESAKQEMNRNCMINSFLPFLPPSFLPSILSYSALPPSLPSSLPPTLPPTLHSYHPPSLPPSIRPTLPPSHPPSILLVVIRRGCSSQFIHQLPVAYLQNYVNSPCFLF